MAQALITQPHDAARVLFRDLVENTGDYPKDIKEMILNYLDPGKSMSFAVSEFAEIVYARKSELSKRVVALGASMAMCASHNQINGFADNDGARGRGIVEALRRHSGEKAPEGHEWATKDLDPPVKDRYLAVEKGE